jgi:DNA-binding transcriptional LysR family regulator
VNLHQLRTFESVARHRSFTRAAEELALTQPAVSVQVKALEESLGTDLFDRAGRQVTLTEAGESLIEYARRILGLLEEARSVIDDLHELRRGRVSISTVTTPGAYVLPPLLGAFQALYPGIRISLEVTNRATVRRRLLDNDVDLTIMGRPPQDLEHVATPFLPNDLVVIAAPTHPLAGKRRIPLARVAEEPLVMREAGSGTRVAVEEHFKEHDLEPRLGLEVGDNSGVKEAVAAGLGVSILSRHALEMELALGRLTLLDVRGFPLHRQWTIVRTPGRRLSRAAEAFERFLVTSAQSILKHEDPRWVGRSSAPVAEETSERRTEVSAPGARVTEQRPASESSNGQPGGRSDRSPRARPVRAGIESAR